MILDGNEGHHFTSRHVIFLMLPGTNMSKRPIIFIIRAEKVALTPTEIVSVVINKWVLVMRSKRAKCELVTLCCQLHRARPDEEDPWCRGHELTKHVKKWRFCDFWYALPIHARGASFASSANGSNEGHSFQSFRN